MPTRRAAIAAALIRYRTLLFWCGIGLFVLSIVGLSRLNVDNNYRNYIGSQNESLQMSDWLSERQGTEGDTFILIYEPGNGTVFDPLSLTQYSEIASSAGSLPYVQATENLLDQERLVRIGTEEGGQAYKAANILLGADLFSEEGLAEFEESVMSVPTVRMRFVGSDGKTAAVLLFTDLSTEDGTRQEKIVELLEAVDAMELQLQMVASNDRLYLSGTPLFEHAAFDVLRKDLRRIFPVAVLCICLVMFVVYRSVVFVPLALIVIFVPVVSTAGLLAGAGVAFSNLSVSALLLVGTLAVADVMHISNTFFSRRSDGADVDVALTDAISSNIGAVLATTLTTMIGQIALLISSAEPIRVMGLVIAVGSAMALFMAVLMLPFVLSKSPARTDRAASGRLAPMIARVGRYSARRPVRIASAFVVVFALALWGVSNSRLSDSLKGWFAEDTDFNRSMTVLDRQYLGPDTITVAIEATADDLLAARQLPDVTDNAEYYKELEAGLKNLPAEGQWLDPVSVAMSSRAQFERQTRIIPTGQPLQAGMKDFTTETAARSGMLTRYRPGQRDYSLWYFDGDDPSAFSTVRNASLIDEYLDRELDGRDHKTGGIGLALAELSVHNFWSVLEGSVIAFLLISVAMLVAFRSWTYGLLSMIPNVAPVALALGVWGAWKGELNLAAITVFSVSLGIVVDDTIHIILKYKEKCRSGLPPEDAVYEALRSCGVGILTTTIVLATGFCLLGTSSFLLTAEKSLLVGWAIIAAFVFDVLVLPALLILRERMMLKSAGLAPLGN
ncbi:MAG: MMPL family transporter [Hyphomonas sp.]|nr:MMPL family transporter [Hyphomonas sp.]